MQSDTVDLYAVGDVMDDRGWNLNRNIDPRGLHVMLSPAHTAVAGRIAALISATPSRITGSPAEGGPIRMKAEEMTPDDLVEIELIKRVKYRTSAAST